ncbi:MAG: D-2-hydroxyacid dehydrogenase [Verrucomicrobia bacterium]|nr:D-2-hydroxyacid dehydrogenase [Verrucomicrobiota bacterium]MCH8526588.1 D-2-hydroxyacid dehydrogenase [Kiritimatiellia bacterium]
MKIYVDFRLPEDALSCLREETRAHELLFPPALSGTVLEPGGVDEGFLDAEIALGQPSPDAVAVAERLRWVHVSSSGITRYDTPAFRALAAEKGLAVTNSAHVYNEACAEHVLSFMLAQSRRLAEGLATPRFESGEAWLRHRGGCVPLRGQCVLIVGFGAIGERLAELLEPFDMKITGCRRMPRGDEPVRMVREAELPDALRGADHVVNILPDSPWTRGFFDEARLGLLKAGATFYNIGRGGTVNQEALLERFARDPGFHAWLDVTEPEPLPADHALWREPRCRITPHVAGGHRGEALTLVRHFSANLRRFECGGVLTDRVM